MTKSIQRNLTETLTANVAQNPNNELNADLGQLYNAYPNSMNYVLKYAFNHHLLKEYEHISYSPFKVPVIFGFFYLRTLEIEQNKFDFALVSRKDCRRPGRRFITRGLDRDGNAANFA